MSDLRSEMVNKVLNQWENVSMHTSNQSVKSFGERVHDYVKAHPYCTIAEVKSALDSNDTQSTASTLKTLYDRGIVNREEKPVRNYPGFGRRTQWEYYSTSDSYETKNQGYWKPKNVVKRGRPIGSVNKPKELIIETPTPELPRMKQFIEPERSFNPEMFVQDLSLKDARAVYEVLKGYFSG